MCFYDANFYNAVSGIKSIDLNRNKYCIYPKYLDTSSCSVAGGQMHNVPSRNMLKLHLLANIVDPDQTVL